MNPFERFLQYKSAIEQNTSLMANLKLYINSDRLSLIVEGTLECTGTGSHNSHFRVGNVNGMWLVTRDYINIQLKGDDKFHCEEYISSAVYYHNEGKRVPKLCGGIMGRYLSRDRHILLVEDLYNGGAANFEPAERSGVIAGTIDGEEVWHDFDTDKMSAFNISEFKYMKDEYLIRV